MLSWAFAGEQRGGEAGAWLWALPGDAPGFACGGTGSGWYSPGCDTARLQVYRWPRALEPLLCSAQDPAPSQQRGGVA